METRLEEIIFRNLLENEDYTRKVLPYLKKEYFQDITDRALFEAIDEFFTKYNACPSKASLIIEIDANDNTLTDEEFSSVNELLVEIDSHKATHDDQWVLDSTEKWCQDKALYNAIMTSVNIMDDSKTSTTPKDAIPTLLQDALAVSFDPSIGHDFIEDAAKRFEFYHQKHNRIPFDLDYFNKITDGGWLPKTLNVFIAGTGVGKTLVMGHMAANNLLDGKNVLYITLEISEERIGERIDANLLDIPISTLKEIPKSTFDSRIAGLRTKTTGKLIVKEYPPGAANALHFYHLIQELKLKKDFVPDIVYVDYINLCSSVRIKSIGSSSGMYGYVKSIAEELRGVAVKLDLPIVTATQLNREGFVSSDVGMENTSESFGLPMSVDFMAAVITSDELEELGQYQVKQLKNRYADMAKFRKFIIGVDKSKMRVYDVTQSAQHGISENEEDLPVMDKTEFAERNVNDFGKWKI